MCQEQVYKSLNVHYQFIDNEHFMDAVAFNKCECQLIGIIKEVARLVDVDVVVNVEALEQGSLWERLGICSTDKNHIKVELIIAFAVGVLMNPIGHTITNAIDRGFEYLKDGAYVTSLKSEKERLQLEKDIRDLCLDSLKNATSKAENKIRRKVSNFYSEAKKEERIVSVGFISSIGNPSKDVYKIAKCDFDSFILSDKLETVLQKDDVRIDIIAPVLSAGRKKIKWVGMYDGRKIPFLMNDVDFRNAVIGGSVVFTGGSYIICDLDIHTSVNYEGDTNISGYEVVAVHCHGIDNFPPVIIGSEKKRRVKKQIDAQPSLFDGVEDYL